MTPVIFLDVDGVLNSYRWFAGDGSRDGRRRKLDPAAVARLDVLVAAGNARVVLSSTWRFKRSLADNEALLRSAGLSATLHGATPRLADEPRGAEIAAWLRAQPASVYPSSYVILDDSYAAGFGHDARFVRTDPDRGLSANDVVQALSILRPVPSTLSAAM